MMPCRATTPTIRCVPSGRRSRWSRFWTGASRACASRLPAGISKAASPRCVSAVDRVAAALGANREIEIPQAERARAAAYVITSSEGGSLHLSRLRTRARDFDPAVRDRLIAGAMVPASLVMKAQKFRRWYRGEVLKLFAEVDAIVAPATPCTAPLIGQQTFMFGDTELPVRANIGIYTQPISFIGLPVVAVPVPLKPLPIGVQIIAAPWREDIVLRIAHALEMKGVARRAAGRRRLEMEAAYMEIDLPEVVAEVTRRVRALREGAGDERRRDAQCDFPQGPAHNPLRHRPRISTATRDRGISRRALAGRPRRARFRGP